MAEQQQGEELAQVVEGGFRQMLASQLVERAPPCDLPPPIEKVHSTAVVGLATQVPRQHQMNGFRIAFLLAASAELASSNVSLYLQPCQLSVEMCLPIARVRARAEDKKGAAAGFD